MSTDIHVRLMTGVDVPAADELRRLVGWNQMLDDWRRFLRLDPHGSFVAVQNGLVAGTVTTISYRSALAWIGMMLVHPERRRQGIGTLLMRKAMEYLQGRGVKCVRLDATPAGYPVYEKLGFVPEWTLTRCQRPENVQCSCPEKSLAQVRLLSDSDRSAIDPLDAAAFGVSRAALLTELIQQSLRALVYPAQGNVAAFGLLRPGRNADYLGPLLCSSAEACRALAEALLPSAGTRSIFWDVPDQNEAAKKTAQALGFAPVRILTRMRYGPASVVSDPQTQFAIADPSVG